jgi:hypothetical protein
MYGGSFLTTLRNGYNFCIIYLYTNFTNTYRLEHSHPFEPIIIISLLKLTNILVKANLSPFSLVVVYNCCTMAVVLVWL